MRKTAVARTVRPHERRKTTPRQKRGHICPVHPSLLLTLADTPSGNPLRSRRGGGCGFPLLPRRTEETAMRSYLSNRGDNPTSLTTFSDGATTRSKAQRGGLFDPAVPKNRRGASGRPLFPAQPCRHRWQ